MAHLDQLEAAYAVDLLSRIVESIETYLDDDRWDGIDTLHAEIAEANKLTRKYWRRVRAEAEKDRLLKSMMEVNSITQEIDKGRK